MREPKIASPYNRGVSLYEVLVVIVIVSVLSGIIFPCIVQAQKRGYRAADIEMMHEVSEAGGLYNNDFGEYPLRIEQLVSSKILDKRLCKLSLDLYPEGFSNHFLKQVSGLKYLADTSSIYPQSFVTLGDFGYRKEKEEEVFSSPNPAWAMCDVDGTAGTKDDRFWGLKYYRIGNDGSVTYKSVPIHEGKDDKGRTTKTLNYKEFFCDPSK